MKKILSVIVAAILLFSFAGCTGKSKEKEENSKPEISEKTGIDMSVACLKGPTGVGAVKLMEDSSLKKTVNNYNFTVAASADEISGKIISGEINIASVPTNLAAKLYSKTGGKIQILAVNTLGVLSILENGNSIKSIKDLKGKTIYSIGEASNPEYILKNVLEKNGILNDVNIQFVATNDDLVASLVSGKAEVAMVAEPVATTVLSKKDTINRVLSLNAEWQKISDGKLMMGCVVALSSFTESNKEAVNAFLDEYENSIKFASASVEKTAELCAKYEIIPNAETAKAAIPNCNLVFISGKDIKTEITDYFNCLFKFNAESIGGKLPEDNFYYEK